MRFDADYLEHVDLPNGERLQFRVARPQDRAALVAGFTRLSPQTRYRRFLGTKRELSEQDLAFLTQCDGVNQYAIVALLTDVGGTEHEGVGVARFIREAAGAESAELAIVVGDHWQGRGIGRHLMLRIIEAAGEWGVTKLQAYTLADNVELRALLERLPMDVELVNEDGLVRFTIPVPDVVRDDTLAVVDHLLRSAAEGTVAVLTTFGRMSLQHWLAVGALRPFQRLGRKRLKLPPDAGKRLWMGTGEKLVRPPQPNPIKRKRGDRD